MRKTFTKFLKMISVISACVATGIVAYRVISKYTKKASPKTEPKEPVTNPDTDSDNPSDTNPPIHRTYVNIVLDWEHETDEGLPSSSSSDTSTSSDVHTDPNEAMPSEEESCEPESSDVTAFESESICENTEASTACDTENAASEDTTTFNNEMDAAPSTEQKESIHTSISLNPDEEASESDISFSPLKEAVNPQEPSNTCSIHLD